MYLTKITNNVKHQSWARNNCLVGIVKTTMRQRVIASMCFNIGAVSPSETVRKQNSSKP